MVLWKYYLFPDFPCSDCHLPYYFSPNCGKKTNTPIIFLPVKTARGSIFDRIDYMREKYGGSAFLSGATPIHIKLSLACFLRLNYISSNLVTSYVVWSYADW